MQQVDCLICGKRIGVKGFAIHINRKHNISLDEYSKKHLSPLICANPKCSNPTKLLSIVKGFNKFCSISCAWKEECNPQWKGGKRFIGEYELVKSKNHPHAYQPGDYVYKHRLVMEEHLGRCLDRDEVVHHINGDVTDNRIENLRLTCNSEHCGHHNKHRVFLEKNREVRQRVASQIKRNRYGRFE